METKAIIEQIKAIASAEDMERVDAQIREQPGQMDPAVQTALLDKLREMTAESKQIREEAIATLQHHGVSYPLTDWLTPKNYAKKFGLKSDTVVLNWINRGVIPEDHIKEIPELGLRLVKAVEYSPRSYDRVAGREKSAS